MTYWTLSLSDEWYTPQYVFDDLGVEFDMDVCSPGLPKACTPAKHHVTLPNEDGLQIDWKGFVWCNPPYGKDVVKWCKKALAESKRGATTVLLMPCKTNTNWWHDFVIPYAEIRFLRGRVAFVYPNGEQTTQALPWPLAFVIYRPNVD